MEYETDDEIPEYSTASLHVSETEDVLNKKDELLTGNKSEKRTQSTFVEVFDVPGQVVPFHTCTNLEKEAKENIEHLTVPRVKLNGLEESAQLTPEVKGVGLFTTSTGLQQENPPKTFLWPPIGLKDEKVTDQSAASQQDTFDQFVSNEGVEKIDDGIAIAEPEQVFKDQVSNHINQPEIHSLQEENHNLTSILKKDENGVKKTVHFPENIVSVKLYDLSDDEDSDNDTVILSDPEEDDLRDQEVPFNTYSDYSTNCYLLSPASVSFIPNFTFPPVLKTNNCQLYEDIDDDDDEQILAIMDDDDGRELSDADTLVADEIDSERNMNDYKDDNLISTEMDKIPDHASKDIEEKTNMTSKEMARLLKCEEENETEYQNPQQASIESANPEDTGKIIDLQLLVPKNGIEHLEDDLNIKFNATDKYCEVQVTAREVKKLSESSSEVYEAQKVSKLNEIERLVDSHKESVSDSQMAPVEIQSQSKFQEVSVPMKGSRDEHFEENFDEKMDEILQHENNDMARKGDASTFMKKIETPVMVGDSKASVSSQKNIKLPHIYTLLDVLKASSSISDVQVKERCCETAEEYPFEDNLIEQEATCSHIVKRNTPPLTTVLPEISVFDSRLSEKVDKKLNVARKSDMMQIRSVENKTVLKCEEPYIDKPAICDNYPTVIGANSVQLLIKNKKAPTEDVKKLPTESVVQNVELQAKDKTKPSTEIVIRKEDFAAEDEPKPDLVTGGGSFKESNDNSDGHVDVSLLTSGCTRTFHRNYGSKFLWRGPRSINTLILDEDFHVQATPTADNDTPHQRPLIKEEITFPNFTVIDYRSLESMIPAAEWNNSKYYYEDSQFEKYPHSFMTSPYHVNEIEETWQSRIETDLSIKKQKVETYDYNTWLKQDCLKSEIGASVKHSETEFDEHQRNRPYSATTFKHINPGDALESSEECVTPHRQPGNPYYPAPQIVPDMYVPCPLKAQPTTDSPRAVPSDGDNLIMDTTNTSLHLTEYPWQSPRKFGNCETVKDESYDKGSSYSPPPILARQGRRRLRVGLSKSTRVKPLHPYWSRERIKEKGSMS